MPDEALAAAGLPVVTLELRDAYDLGAEFFRWEFATAVAAVSLQIDPFDEPKRQGVEGQHGQRAGGLREEWEACPRRHPPPPATE